MRVLSVTYQFLVSVWADPHTLGMFISDRGNPTRAPIEWPEKPSHVAFRNPYIVAYCPSPELLVVHG